MYYYSLLGLQSSTRYELELNERRACISYEWRGDECESEMLHTLVDARASCHAL